MSLEFKQLNDGWNAEPNAPLRTVSATGADVVLTVGLNPWQFPSFGEGDVGVIKFIDCSRYRLGPTNEEGWYAGECRYSKAAPTWGEFYELVGPDPSAHEPADWIATQGSGQRHFLFYLRDDTFECFAKSWDLSVMRAAK